MIISRFGENAFQVIQDAKTRLFELEDGLPHGVFIKPTYDRSALIDRSVDTLRRAVIEELIVTALIMRVFLAHVRSAFVAVFVLPAGLLASILVMQLMGINANIMSLGGLALAISVMVDSSLVSIHCTAPATRDAVFVNVPTLDTLSDPAALSNVPPTLPLSSSVPPDIASNVPVLTNAASTLAGSIVSRPPLAEIVPALLMRSSYCQTSPRRGWSWWHSQVG